MFKYKDPFGGAGEEGRKEKGICVYYIVRLSSLDSIMCSIGNTRRKCSPKRVLVKVFMYNRGKETCCTDPLRSTAYNAGSRSFMNASDYCRKGMLQVIEKEIYQVGGGLLYMLSKWRLGRI